MSDIGGGTAVGGWCEHGQSIGSCPFCRSGTVQPAMQPGQIFTMPMGCICPPGANKDCENPACPRRNPFKAGA